MVGLQVGDIKKMNGLVTDLQMYALNSIKIPLPRRHLPSPSFNITTHAHGSRQVISGVTPKPPPSYSLNSRSCSSRTTPAEYHNISPAMTSLQGYYGLKPPAPRDNDDDHKDKEKAAAAATFLKRLRTNGVMNLRIGRQVLSDDGINLLHTTATSELLLLKEDNDGGSNTSSTGGAFSASGIAGSKGLALRSKASARTAAQTHQGVRKCSSTPSLQLDKTTRSSWGWVNPDHVTTTTRPSFDGLLPNPTTAASWKKKAALD